ncbi:hypothetical protein VitviT2T_011563 [Vitis vinifera]|uniref:Uncharacterized protein n=1 Tax=Vitis vinifera TaxID=29760 RepID=A0ABY9CDR2_VITVI|nr:hypothetical protein VitviT2T_011563 [Vitis vinifera]
MEIGEAGSGVFRWLWRRIEGVGAEQDLVGKSFPRWSSRWPGLFSAPPLPVAPAARLTGGVESKPKSSFSSSGISNREPFSCRIFRSPIEMGCCVESRLPFHAAMASALFNSMLSVSHRSYGWAPEVCNVDV